ncbi:nitroreductase family deazaflavin-dependent oxidoreductase [Streptomyces sp. SID8379]|uniref:nitroreductase/quinone reductase family protein n=1 Tax=unclassified Streptomyces TaxID=2593676 RepID=UPI000363BE8B|nr:MULTISPECIES: nitroreductase/quinone reductase family protein [unclassified Streptomyces]MYW67009.1 nitroreductase family deazaflavin-dependent oxidoreductase [Streptomyces sp. SID8379]
MPENPSDLLLLTTTGARSGRPHTVPLGCVRHAGLLLVVASNLGADRHPAWYHNLLARPVVTVELDGYALEAVAVPAQGARRDELFAAVVRAAPGYADHQAATARTLPVVVLDRPTTDAPATVTTLAGKLLQVHVWLREQLRRVREETEAHLAGTDTSVPGLGLQIRQHCLAFCQSLEFHHVSEDGHLFPGIARWHPELADVLERLRAEHVEVARMQKALVALVDDVTTADPVTFRAELARMTKELIAHLDHEEEHLLPVLADVPWPPPRP